MRHHLARALIRSLFIFLILLIGVFFYTSDYIASDIKPTFKIQAHNDPIVNQLAQGSTGVPTIWLGTDTAKSDVSAEIEKSNQSGQFRLTGAKEDTSYQTCSVEHMAPQNPLPDNRPSLSLHYLADVLTSAVESQYFVYLWSPLEDVETYALNSDTEAYEDAIEGVSYYALDCGEQTMLIPASLMTHLSTFLP
ncbi:MAG: hypothetical protein KDJ52_05400 [Anaerolineae bacterium]|nr:hypothetical protein [Anaerolineae bacterium]